MPLGRERAYAGRMHEEVRAAVQRYVDGCVAADPSAVADAFDENAVMWGYLGPDYATMTGEIAHAVLDEWGFLGANFRNHFGLIGRDGVWRITSKVFTTRS